MQNDISKKLAVKRALRVNDFCDAYRVCRATAYKMMKKRNAAHRVNRRPARYSC